MIHRGQRQTLKGRRMAYGPLLSVRSSVVRTFLSCTYGPVLHARPSAVRTELCFFWLFGASNYWNHEVVFKKCSIYNKYIAPLDADAAYLWVALGFTEKHLDSLKSTWIHWKALGFTEKHLDSLKSTWIHWKAVVVSKQHLNNGELKIKKENRNSPRS
jgi:hypothetical protein